MNTFTSHFPERLGTCIMLNPPTILEILLAVMRPLLDARTLGKAHVVRTTHTDAKSFAAAFEPFGIIDTAQLEFLHAALILPPKAGELPDLSLLKGAADDISLHNTTTTTTTTTSNTT